MKPLFSIVVPVYNVEKYVVQCVESILSQSFRDFELILVDDGSTDNSGRICDEFAAKNEQAIVIHQENGGLSQARNSGLKVANGEFVWFVDSDDWVDSESLMTIEKYITEYDPEVIAFSHVDYFEDTDKYSHIINPQDIAVTTGREYIRISKHFFTGVWLHVYKRQFLIDNGCAFKPGQIHEDDYFNLSYYGRISKIMKISRGLYFYRRRSGSLTTSLDKNVLEKRALSYASLIALTNTVTDLDTAFLMQKNAEYKKILFGVLRNYLRTDASSAEKLQVVKSLKREKIKFSLSKADFQQSKKSFLLKWAFNVSGKLFVILGNEKNQHRRSGI